MVGTRLEDRITIVTIQRPEVRNAVDRDTAEALAYAFRQFDADPHSEVAILEGAGGNFCAGADLKAFNNHLSPEGDGPMGPTRMRLSKPVIAAVEGFAVAGGLELALWCDLRVAAKNAVFGVFCRRFGVPLIDLGTIRLPRLIGQSHALDMILTGRPVPGEEALRMGLANRLTEPGLALDGAFDLAQEIAAHPQQCLRSDRLSVYEQWDLSWEDAARNEFRLGMQVIESGEAKQGASRFAGGLGRHGGKT
ncbi:MAG TPA: crotonase/enoyl-CoA hydratase family protein [Bryobacteraceae bacterium]|jgi:enoyl-CoA hydratase|nr:crotonase/enoyl-CoA hydratase family protein [Bryobacteraceae bacterium]